MAVTKGIAERSILCHWVDYGIRRAGRRMIRNRVLFYGHDELLMTKRLMILRFASIEVSTASDERNFVMTLCDEGPAVVVLCQTLTTNECIRAADFTHIESPYSKLLVMVNAPGKCPIAGEHVSLDLKDEPEALLNTVKELIASSSRARLQEPHRSGIARFYGPLA